MCEYCGCQQIDSIAELTREHDAIVIAAGEIGRQVGAGELDSAAITSRLIVELLRPHTSVEEEGLFPCLAADFPDHVGVLRAEHRQIEAVLAESAFGVPGDPSWPARLLATLYLLREHILKEQDGLFPAALVALDTDQWKRIDEIRTRVGSALPLVHPHRAWPNH
ncbi:hemerythrin domain-containing protein [Lapillicoccus sp.]|uniref:hemerythrin domain-containing protein n=1 Tax=Lapillicoccus sp. TaxID=1909287 RepID=UPI0025D51037|nr:hemerythrin domain-containing protein [Lapillicoccus sp.]